MKHLIITYDDKPYDILLDDEDYSKLPNKGWYIQSLGYPARTVNRVMTLLHRLVVDYSLIDHKNGNKLDNRKSNLRDATHSQNMHNRKIHKNNKSGFKGVYWKKTHAKWAAQIRVSNRKINLGYFTSKIEAAKAYDTAAQKLHGEFARLNGVI